VRKLPQNVITRALGMMDNLRVSMRSHALVHGDRYLLCSDGLSDHVNDDQIAESLMLDVPCDELVALLVSMALDAGAKDNVACVIIDCALPALAGKAAATRPIKTSVKRASRPRQPVVDVVTEESVPEIVLYDRPEQRDSSPLIHVVPTESSSPEVVQAIQGVLSEDEPITKEYRSPPGATMPEEREAAREAARKTPTQPTRPQPQLQTPIAGIPASAAAPKDGTERGGAAAAAHASSSSAASPSSPAVKLAAKPSSPGRGTPATGTPIAAARKPAPGAAGASPAASGATSTAATAGAPGAAASGPAASGPVASGAPPSSAAATPATAGKVTAPRVRKPEIDIDDEETRTGDTQQPPGTLPPKGPSPVAEPEVVVPLAAPMPSSPLGKLPKRPPPALPDGVRTTMPGTGPALPPESPPPSAARGDKAVARIPLPPARGPLDTSDFTNDSIPCHACGSVIMRTAAQCMYCGAPTGFITKDKEPAPE
jgi:hypothetical protein